MKEPEKEVIACQSAISKMISSIGQGRHSCRDKPPSVQTEMGEERDPDRVRVWEKYQL